MQAGGGGQTVSQPIPIGRPGIVFDLVPLIVRHFYRGATRDTEIPELVVTIRESKLIRARRPDWRIEIAPIELGQQRLLADGYNAIVK